MAEMYAFNEHMLYLKFLSHFHLAKCSRKLQIVTKESDILQRLENN